MTAHLANGVIEDLLLLICLSTNQLIVQTITGPRDTYLIVCRHLRVHKSLVQPLGSGRSLMCTYLFGSRRLCYIVRHYWLRTVFE